MTTMKLVVAEDDDNEPRGPMDDHIGRLLIDCEKRIRANDLESLENRHYSGGLMIKKRGDAKRMPNGVRQALVETLGISSREINYRMKLNEKCQFSELSNLLHSFLTWENIARKALVDRPTGPKKPAKKGPAPLARTARTWTETLRTRAAAKPLTETDKHALARLAKLIHELLVAE